MILIKHFQTTNDPHVISLYNKKIAPNKKRKTANYLKAHDGLQRVKKGGFAFQIESATAYKIVDVIFFILLYNNIIKFCWLNSMTKLKYTYFSLVSINIYFHYWKDR